MDNSPLYLSHVGKLVVSPDRDHEGGYSNSSANRSNINGEHCLYSRLVGACRIEAGSRTLSKMIFFLRNHAEAVHEILTTMVIISLVIATSVIGVQVYIIRKDHSEGSKVFKQLIEEQKIIQESQVKMHSDLQRVEQKINSLLFK